MELRLLFIDACPRDPAVSRTHRLCRAFLEAFREGRPEAGVEALRLTDLGLAPFDGAMAAARDALRTEGKLDAPMFDLPRQFASADRILIGAPYWDYSFPALLKIYIDHVSCGKILFDYDDAGAPHGLCRATRIAYIVTAGSPIDPGDWGAGYIAALARELYGIPRLDQVRAEGLDIIGNDAKGILARAEAEARALAREF